MKIIGKYLNRKGMTLIEVLVASVIFSFVILSFGYIFALGQGLIGSQGERRVALSLAKESIERIQGQGNATTTAFTWLRADFDNPGNAYGWSKSGMVWSNSAANENVSNAHRRDISVSYVNDDALDTVVTTSGTLRITVTVSHPQSEYKAVVLSKLLTRPGQP